MSDCSQGAAWKSSREDSPRARNRCTPAAGPLIDRFPLISKERSQHINAVRIGHHHVYPVLIHVTEFRRPEALDGIDNRDTMHQGSENTLAARSLSTPNGLPSMSIQCMSGGIIAGPRDGEPVTGHR